MTNSNGYKDAQDIACINLWRAVIQQAKRDLEIFSDRQSQQISRDGAKKWFQECNQDFQDVCDFACVDKQAKIDEINIILKGIDEKHKKFGRKRIPDKISK